MTEPSHLTPSGTRHRSLPLSGSSLSVVAAIATTLLLWSAAFVAIRVAVADFSVPGLTLARLLVASVALAAAAPVLKVRVPARADLPRLIACALTGMTGYQFFLNAGERTVDAGTANLLVNTSPVLAAILAWVLLASRPTTRVWVGIGLGFTGASILALAQGGGVRLSVDALLVLAAASCQATFFVIQKPLLRRYTAFEVTCYATWIATFSALPAAAHLIGDTATVNTAALASVIFLGVGSSAVAYVTWAYVLGRIDVATASNTLYLAPLLTIVIGWALINETPSTITLVGGGIILAGVAIARPSGLKGARRTQEGGRRRRRHGSAWVAGRVKPRPR
jgi:drug/metabolite transporter (DMT)-like permease